MPDPGANAKGHRHREDWVPGQSRDESAPIRLAFREARRAARALPDFPGDIPRSLEAAYALQSAAIAEWPDRVAGWKVGFIAPHQRDRFPAERLVGPIFAADIQRAEPGGTVDVPSIAGGFTAIEAEVLLCLATDVAPAAAPWGTDLQPLIKAAHLGVEPAGSPLSSINDLGPAVIVSDFGNNAGLIVGPALPDWRRILNGHAAELTVDTFIDGTLVGTGTPDSIPNGPLGALRFLLDHAAARGLTLPAGTWVSTGAVTGVHRVDAGAAGRIVATGVDPIALRIVAARPRAADTGGQ